MRGRSLAVRGLVLVALGMSLTGCDLLPGSGGDAAPAVSGAGKPGAAVVDSGGLASAQATGDLPVLASLKGQIDGIDIQVDLNDLQVTGDAVRLTFTGRNVGQGADFQVAGKWGDGAFDLSHVELIDTANSKRYLAARDSRNECVCTLTNGLFIDPGKGAVFTMLFGAPPPDVETVEVVVPGIGTFTGVKPGR